MEDSAYDELVRGRSVNEDDFSTNSGNPTKTPSINASYIPVPNPSLHPEKAFQVNLERARSRYLTVELPLLLVTLSISILSTLRSEYLRERIARDVYHYNTSTHNKTCGGNSSSVEDGIQATTAQWLLILGAINAIPGLFMAIILGSISDRLGRKPALGLCLFGYLLNTAGNILVIYFHLPIPAFIAGDLIGGLGGGLSLLLSTSAAYVSDLSSAKTRTMRIVIVETMLFVGFGIGQIALGFTLQESQDPTLNKYLPPLWIALGCTLASLVYVLSPWLIIETVDRKKADKAGSQVTKVLVGIYHLLKENTDKRRMKVIGYTVIMMFAVFVVQSASQVFVVYSLGEPFCLGPLEVSFVSVTSVVSGSIGMIVGGAVLPRFLNDNWILQICLVNSILTSLITGLATTKWMLYLSSALSLVKALSFPVIRSQLSKMSAAHEKGLMLAFIGCMDGLAGFLSPLISNSIYSSTLYFYPPFVFFFLCGLHIIPIIVTGLLQLSQRNSYKQLVNDSDEKEN
ncbi:proton-coupled folate transporter-like [Lytechinus pictus]|uniref:proton-coupled folate transporter-like n=1 Tax=Lytechinus pictus TaxID=7653 RepID=UPI0030B9D4F5